MSPTLKSGGVLEAWRRLALFKTFSMRPWRYRCRLPNGKTAQLPFGGKLCPASSVSLSAPSHLSYRTAERSLSPGRKYELSELDPLRILLGGRCWSKLESNRVFRVVRQVAIG
jgi:hypothetical protein